MNYGKVLSKHNEGITLFDDDILFQDLLQELIHVFLLQNDFQVESAAFLLELYPYLLNLIYLCDL